MSFAGDFATIREWDGSKARAWEELCYQLRPPAPPGTTTTKTGDPDAGLEWYVTLPGGHQWGWQAKYSDDFDGLLAQMRSSLTTIVLKRPEVVRLTFCIPIDLPEGRDRPGAGRSTRSQRNRFESALLRWKSDINGAAKVDVRLDGGGEILDRLSRPEHAGRRWFWWQERVLDLDWFHRRLKESIETAGPRYSATLNVDLSIGRELDGLADNESFRSRHRAAHGAVARRIADVTPRIANDADATALRDAVERFRTVLPSPALEPPRDAAERERWGSAVQELEVKAWAYAYQSAPQDASEAWRGARADASRLASELDDLAAFIGTAELRAASDRAYLLLGEAGSGKTHLFLDHAKRSLDAGCPALVLLGQRFSGDRGWVEICEQIGLANLDADVVVGALDAAAQAHGCRLVLLIDALNEADEPARWRSELPAVRQRLLASPHLALGLSCRSGYEKMLGPEDGWEANYAVGRHPGFAGAEARAMRVFFAAYGIEDPRVPLLGAAFANPLFLKLWCEGLQDAGLTSPPAGSGKLTAMFDRYLAGRGDRIAGQLRLDPSDRVVERAARALAERMAQEGVGHLSRAVAKEIVDGFTPDLTAWPRTLYARMLSEGLLIEDAHWGRGESNRATRFAYQLFSDHRIASAILDHQSVPVTGPLADQARFRRWLDGAPAGLLDAMAVQLPERFDRELPDLVRTRSGAVGTQHLRAFLHSLVFRRVDAIGDRVMSIVLALEAAAIMEAEILATQLAVAAEPSHPLNSEYIHERLAAMSMAQRDANWTILLYDSMSEPTSGPSRLIRWASAGPYPAYPTEVLRLASMALAWLLTSANRTLRDTATKALANLWRGHLKVATSIIERFAAVNDPFVVERVVLASYGAMMRGGDDQPEEARALAVSVLSTFFSSDEVVPQALLRDAAMGIVAWAESRALIDEAAAARARGPFRSAPPATPSSPARIKRRRDNRAFVSIAASLSAYGDFGDYIVGRRLDSFSRARKSDPESTSRIFRPYDADRARRWVFDRVLSFGWSGQLFGSFDDRIHSPDRQPPSRERIGKKYQWIAVDELLARLQDNHRVIRYRYTGEEDSWGARTQRQLDPSLPPPNLDALESAPFAKESTSAWWVRGVPTFPRDEDAQTWVARTDLVPSLGQAVRYDDPSGRGWVALAASSSWTEPSDRRDLDGRRHQWWRIEAWLVPRGDASRLAQYLETQDVRSPWMPDPPEFGHGVYLGEIGYVGDGVVDGRDRIYRAHIETGDVEPIPSFARYTWGSRDHDFSLQDTARLWAPSPSIIRANRLRWDGVGGRWLLAGRVVAQYHEVETKTLDGGQLLLIDVELLSHHLEEGQLALVAVLVGEREVYHRDTEAVEPWWELKSVATFDGAWDFGDMISEKQVPARLPANRKSPARGSRSNELPKRSGQVRRKRRRCQGR